LDTPKNSSFMIFLPTAVILSLVGWGGLVALIFVTLPTLGPRWLFFFLTVLALSGTSLPVAYFLNLRFPSKPPADPMVVVRQSIWVGVYAGTLTWLQLGRMLTLASAGILAGVLIVIEILLRMREISRFSVNSKRS
jgi:hypothetical protein